MTYFTYILETINSKNKIAYYTGSTNNLEKRVKLHKAGRGAKFCKGKKLRLVYYETFKTRGEAMKRENKIKTFSKNKKIKLIKGEN